MIHLSPLYPEMPLDMMESDLKNFYAPGALWEATLRRARMRGKINPDECRTLAAESEP